MCVLDSRRCPRAKKASVRVAETFAPERTFSMREVLEAALRIYVRRFFYYVGTGLIPILLSLLFCCCGVCLGAIGVGIATGGADGSRIAGERLGMVLAVLGFAALLVFGVIPVALQTHATHAFARGETTSLRKGLEAVVRGLAMLLVDGLFAGGLFIATTAFCFVPGIPVAGVLAFVPSVAVSEAEGPLECTKRAFVLMQRAGVRGFFAPAAFGVTSIIVVVVASGLAAFLDRGGPTPIGVIITAEALVAVVLWVLFTYFIVVVPAVLYTRLVDPPERSVEVLNEIFA